MAYFPWRAEGEGGRGADGMAERLVGIPGQGFRYSNSLSSGIAFHLLSLDLSKWFRWKESGGAKRRGGRSCVLLNFHGILNSFGEIFSVRNCIESITLGSRLWLIGGCLYTFIWEIYGNMVWDFVWNNTKYLFCSGVYHFWKVKLITIESRTLKNDQIRRFFAPKFPRTIH